MRVGMVELSRQRDIHRLSAELGYWLGEEYYAIDISDCSRFDSYTAL